MRKFCSAALDKMKPEMYFGQYSLYGWGNASVLINNEGEALRLVKELAKHTVMSVTISTLYDGNIYVMSCTTQNADGPTSFARSSAPR